jgi:hypothetical protein
VNVNMDKATGTTSGKLGPQSDNRSKKGFSEFKSRDSSVGIATRLQAGRSGF